MMIHTRFHSLSGGGPFCDTVETLFSFYRSFLLDLLCGFLLFAEVPSRLIFRIIYYLYSCSLQVALRRVSQT